MFISEGWCNGRYRPGGQRARRQLSDLCKGRDRIGERGQSGSTDTMSQPENEAQERVPEQPVLRISIDAVPKGEWKDVGGGDRDRWNDRISRLVLNALPP